MSIFSLGQRSLLLLLLIVALVLAAEKTYYEILGISKDASLTDIKKAYRKLALQHHPDRNRGNEKEAELIFREVAAAYEVLSDEKSRQEYDQSLKWGGAGAGGGGGAAGSRAQFHRQWQQRRGRGHRDAFAQFNDLFQNDAFFKEAFQGMDDLFNQMFENVNNNNNAGGGGDVSGGGGGFFGNLLNNMGINFEMTTTTNFGGRASTTTRSYNRRARASNSRGGASSSSSSTYSTRSTRTVIENGRRVTIQSLEKDGNKIEEKYVGEQLVERRINGKLDDTLLASGREGGRRARSQEF